MGVFKIFSESFDAPVKHITTQCMVSRPAWAGKSASGKSFTAIWDTGATMTTISSRVVKSCELVKSGEISVNTIIGAKRVGLYKIDLRLPSGVLIPLMTAMESDSLSDCDVLIGLDVIQTGNFAISFSPKTGMIHASFRLPSGGVVDLSNPGSFGSAARANGCPWLSRLFGRLCSRC